MNHKYGFHTNRTGDDILDAIKRLKPAIVKALDHNIGFWSRVRAVHPDVFLIGRLVVDASEQEGFVHNPREQGRAFAERILRLEVNHSTFEGRRIFDAWESYNEVMPESASPDRKRAYDEFQVGFAGPIHQAGFEPIGMNFATGNMLGHDFLTYFPGTLETYRYLGFHEYDWPTLWRLHEENIREKNEGGMWLALRYRRAMNDVRRVYGNRHIAIITECGLTQGVVGRDDVGWRHEPVVNEDSYWQSLLWYNQQLMQDDYVAGACLFVVGAAGGWPKWESFEHLGGIVSRLEAYQGEGGVVVPPQKPKPLPALHEKLLAAGEQAQVIQFNPDAALQKHIFADGFVPNSPEFELEVDDVSYVGQRAEALGTGEVRVYYVVKGHWDQVTFARRLEPGPPRRVKGRSGSRRSRSKKTPQ